MSESWTMAGIGGGMVVPIVELACLTVMAGILVVFFRRKKLLIVTVQAILSVFAVLRANAAEVVSNKVVFVDQHGTINAPEVVASVSDMASNKTEIAIAQAAAKAAEDAARTGTNLVAATVQAITDNELVIYRRGFTDSLGVLVALPEDTKVFIEGLQVALAQDGAGNIQHELVYATNNDAGKVVPQIKYSNTLDAGHEFKILEGDVEFSALDGDYTDADGNHYGYRYSVKFWTKAESKGFYIVYLDADAADGEGMTFDIQGGITGGATEVVETGHSGTLLFEGGLLIDIAK